MSDGNVLPFRRQERKPLPPAEAALHRRTQRAQPGARALAAEQNAKQQAGYRAAVSLRQAEKLIETGKVVPARITLALDMHGLEGPEVDAACGAAEPDVDMWEAGLAVPSPDQVKLLAKLTGYGVVWFYRPMKAGPVHDYVFICGQGGRDVQPPDVITEDGVLLYGGEPREVPDTQGLLF